tara:strand:+ start:3017 stop:3175 length:159 start_codon:yes stop_codon:yes gene_type:complete
MDKNNKLKILKGPQDVGAIKRRVMHTNASTMSKLDWEKKYKGFSYSDFYRGG